MGIGDLLKKAKASVADATKLSEQAVKEAQAAAARAGFSSTSAAAAVEDDDETAAMDDDVEGDENIHVHGESEDSKVIRSSGEADLVEDDGERQWTSRVDEAVPRDRWTDDWGPLPAGPGRLEEFCLHEYRFEQARAGDPDAAEQKLLSLGYRDVGHFFRVRCTIVKHYAKPYGPLLRDSILDSQEYQNAAIRATQRAAQEDAGAFEAANQELFAPIEGVTLELYAQGAARQAAGASQAELAAFLAPHGVDSAAFARASDAWTQRMSSDTTLTLGTKYSQMLMAAGQGSAGAAGAAGAAAAAVGGVAPAGAEPMPFERFCEVSGATTAWATTGQDVNALMQQKFGLSALDFANVSTWWMMQLVSDMPRMTVFNTQRDAWTAKYKAGTPSASSGITF